MNTSSQEILHKLRHHLYEMHGEKMDKYLIPPPAFESMHGDLLDVDINQGTLTTRFPILEEHLNPYRTLQGGYLAAMFDNTIGPLSMLVAPPNVTRRLEITFSKPVHPTVTNLTIQAAFQSQEDRQLRFRADARDPQGTRVARAQATHWILD